jgi:hypothetical protein
VTAAVRIVARSETETETLTGGRWSLSRRSEILMLVLDRGSGGRYTRDGSTAKGRRCETVADPPL